MTNKTLVTKTSHPNKTTNANLTYSINGKFVKDEQAVLHVRDLTLRRGYGAFDFFRTAAGVPLFLSEHLERFSHSATRLGLPLPLEPTALTQHIHELLAHNQVDKNKLAVGVQLFLTSGYAPDNFTPTTPNLVILQTELSPLPAEKYQQGVNLITHTYLRDLPDVKSTNYFMALYLIKKMQQANAFDVLYVNSDEVLETTRANFFIISKNQEIITADKNVLAGITRANVLKIAQKHYSVQTRPITWQDVVNAQEAFITSTTKGILPIVKIDDTTVGTGEVGKVTQNLRSLFLAHVAAYIDEHS